MSHNKKEYEINNLILKIAAKAYRILESHRNFSSDSLANIAYLNEGLSNREEKVNEEHHKDVIKRIFASYHADKEEQKLVSLPYQPGGAWKEDIVTRRFEYLEALNSNDYECLSRLLRNFFRNSGIAGLWNYGYFKDILNATNSIKKQYINKYLRDYKTVLDFVDGFDVSMLTMPSVGNPWGYLIKGILVLPTACRHYYYASHIHNLLKDIGAPAVCEIGGGFGGFAYYLLSANRGAKYIDFDLPEVLLVAEYFLMMAFPEKKVLLFGEKTNVNISKETINNYDIILMPNFSLPNIDDKVADLFINTGSLSEMDYHTVEEYIINIARITKEYFFHDNSDRALLNTGGHIEIESSKYPIPLNTFQRIYKSNSLWSGGDSRYREHLYKRMKSQTRCCA